ncbi:MAG: transposase [Methylophilaceae bacterium]|nr:transposase [Methylophilaceae bacterium]
MTMRPHASALRRGRHSEAGRIYLVTTVTRERQHIFRDFHAARVLVQALRQEEAMRRATTLAYVVMPDHLHWLMQLGEVAALPDVVRAVKAVTAHRLGGAIWQKGFHDHALRREEDVVALARYVVANPLRAGLVKRLGDYPHWDAMWL